jgi:hypothetical protein
MSILQRASLSLMLLLTLVVTACSGTGGASGAPVVPDASDGMGAEPTLGY